MSSVVVNYMTPAEDAQLEAEVVAELQAGNWPECPNCALLRREHDLTYVGIVTHAPTFTCSCGLVFAMDLGEAPE